MAILTLKQGSVPSIPSSLEESSVSKASPQYEDLPDNTTTINNEDIIPIPPPSPPPNLSPVVLSGSPPPTPPEYDDDGDDQKLVDAEPEEDSPDEESKGSKSSTESSPRISVTPPDTITSGPRSTTPDEMSKVKSTLTPDFTAKLHPDLYPPLPPIPPDAASRCPLPMARRKSTGILNYPGDLEYTRSRSASLPAIGDEPHPQGRSHSASSSTVSLNVKFAPLPQLAPRKRKSSTPLGVAARGQMMRKRRQQMMINAGRGDEWEESQSNPQANMYGDVVEKKRQPSDGSFGGGMWTAEERDEHLKRLAAAQARERAKNTDAYIVDEDGEEMEDPFVALGRMFKGAWRKMSKSDKDKDKEKEKEKENGKKSTGGKPGPQVDNGDGSTTNGHAQTLPAETSTTNSDDDKSAVPTLLESNAARLEHVADEDNQVQLEGILVGIDTPSNSDTTKKSGSIRR